MEMTYVIECFLEVVPENEYVHLEWVIWDIPGKLGNLLVPSICTYG